MTVDSSSEDSWVQLDFIKRRRSLSGSRPGSLLRVEETKDPHCSDFQDFSSRSVISTLSEAPEFERKQKQRIVDGKLELYVWVKKKRDRDLAEIRLFNCFLDPQVYAKCDFKAVQQNEELLNVSEFSL